MVGGGKCEDGKEIERKMRGWNRGVESVRRKWEELAVKVAFVYVLYGSIEKKPQWRVILAVSVGGSLV